MGTIYKIFVTFGFLSACIMYHNVTSNGMNTTFVTAMIVNEIRCNLIRIDIISVGIDAIITILLNLLRQTCIH